MKTFLTRLFVTIGILSTLIIAMGTLAGLGWYKKMTTPPEPPTSMILSLDFSEPLVEQSRDFSFSLRKIFYEETVETPLIVMLRAIDNARNDPKVKGIVGTFGTHAPTLVQVQEIGAALDKFRESGKYTYVYANSYGDFAPGGTLYALASHFDNIWLQPVGAVALTPISIEAPFGKTALSKLGVETDFMRREDYKSVMENVSRDSFSPAVKENMQSMLGNLNDQLAQSIAVGRKIDFAKAKSLITEGPYTANEAIKNSLVTKLGYADELNSLIDENDKKISEVVDPSTYLYFFGLEQKDEPKARVALIYADGAITDEPVKGPSRLAEDDMIDTEEVVQAFRDAAEDEEIKAILFRVNSPGGSPIASESMRRALIKAKEAKKPVFVSMGRVAASGGYWIAMDADKIIANPGTITGSIGVVAGKFVLGGLFDKLGVKWDEISGGGNAAQWSMRLPFNDKGRERMNAMLDDTYKTFTDNVAKARKIAPEKVGDVAKGRVFTGEQALKVGLVDELGGMNTAIESLKKQLGLNPEDRITIHQYPQPETPAEIVLRVLQHIGFGGAMVQSGLNELKPVIQIISPLIQSIKNPSMQTTMLPQSFDFNGQ